MVLKSEVIKEIEWMEKIDPLQVIFVTDFQPNL